MSDETQKCPECNGSGQKEKILELPCKNCDGEGFTTAPGSKSRYTCAVCAGECTREVRKAEKCTRCKGSGSIKKRPSKASTEKASDSQGQSTVGKRVLANGDGPAPKAKAKTKASPVAPPAGGSSEEPSSRDPEEASEESGGRGSGGQQEEGVRCEINVNMTWCGTIMGGLLAMFGFLLFVRGRSAVIYVLGALVLTCGIGIVFKAIRQDSNIQGCRAIRRGGVYTASHA